MDTHNDNNVSVDALAKLDALLKKYANTEFAYGVSDCATFFGDVYEIMTGRNPIRSCGTYNDEKSALKVLDELKAGCVLEFVQGHLRSIAVLEAADGDFVTLRGVDYMNGVGRFAAPAVVVSGKVFGYGIGGLTMLGLQDAVAAYRVSPKE